MLPSKNSMIAANLMKPSGSEAKQRQSTIQSSINIYSKMIGVSSKDLRILKTAHSTKGIINNYDQNSIQSSIPVESKDGSKKSSNLRTTATGIFTNFENYERIRSKQVERENKLFGKNSVKSYNILRAKHLSKNDSVGQLNGQFNTI